MFCYSYVACPDALTTTLRAAADQWRDIWGQSDDDTARQIRGDRIDILVDLTGHTSDNRLLVFARRPAPVQATYLGYANTTGMPCIDWRIVDSLTDPVHSEASCVEGLMRLDRCFVTYAPIEYTSISDPPFLTNNFVTFGSFNNIAKMNQSVIEVWAGVLHSVANSRLLLKHDMSHDSVVQRRLATTFQTLGIDPSRIELLHRTQGRAEHLATYGRIDVALDTFPYGGTTTTCEALWMGVPVVTLAGASHASRVGNSLLTNVGLPSCVAGTHEDYIQIASELACSKDLLIMLRHNLRVSMTSSVLMDQTGMGASMTRAFRAMWHAHCAKAD